ncbi:MAG: spore germination protein, partial [Clostridia bacterium]
MKKFSKTYETNLNMINKKLRVGESFDILVKQIKIADKKATFYCLDGFTKDDILERMFRFISTFTKEQMSDIHSAEELLNSYITYIESSVEENLDTFTTFILSGAVGMIVEGF